MRGSLLNGPNRPYLAKIYIQPFPAINGDSSNVFIHVLALVHSSIKAHHVSMHPWIGNYKINRTEKLITQIYQVSGKVCRKFQLCTLELVSIYHRA